MKTYLDKNRQTVYAVNNAYRRNRFAIDINFKLASILRSRLSHAVVDNQKSGSAVRDLGCSMDEFKTYLESKFQSGMNWNNYGTKGWHIDHIVPISFFDLADHEELKKACHYTNLQPLWWQDNLRKSDKNGS